MAAKAIAIEIGYSLTKVCEVDYKAKTHKIYKSFTVPNGAEVISDGALMVSPEYVETLRSALSANHVKGKQVVFTITSSKIASREVTIPYVKENRIADVVNANATDYFPVDLSQYQLAYTILGTIGETKGAQQYKLLVMAVPTALLSGYYELAKALKLEVAAIDYAGNSIFQVVKDECAKGRHIVVKIDERSSLVMAVENSVLSFTRSVSYGVEEIMDTVMNTLCWGEVSSVEQAIRVLQRNECIVPEEDAGDSESAEENAKSAKDSALEDMREAVIPLIGGITRVIDYYASRNSGAGIERILITGMGADFKGMDEMLSRETNMPVAILKEAAGWNLMRNFKNECFSEYIACVGAAVAPLGFKQEPEKRSKGKAKKEAGEGGTNWAPLAYTVFGVGLVAAAALVAVPMIGYAKLTKTNMELKAQAGSLEDIIPIYNEYVEVKAEHAMADAMYEATESRNESLEEFLGELEDKLPANVNVISFSSDAYEVSINMRVQTKDDAGAAVEQMRTFQSLIPERVTVASLVEEENEESGERVVNFTVTAAYQDVGYMSEEELPEETGAAADSVTDGANADMAE
ncbi:MAG: pilus assembly protein PilM [Lachnospiraceae bacterium]|jgi:type IV pilus assembly protein PilN|nr:pilus assembly protein PilM [Lachnospiraceae bacterium]